jgi:hypothetical protein
MGFSMERDGGLRIWSSSKFHGAFASSLRDALACRADKIVGQVVSCTVHAFRWRRANGAMRVVITPAAFRPLYRAPRLCVPKPQAPPTLRYTQAWKFARRGWSETDNNNAVLRNHKVHHRARLETDKERPSSGWPTSCSKRSSNHGLTRGLVNPRGSADDFTDGIALFELPR